MDEHDPALRKRLELPPWADDEVAGELNAGGAGAQRLPRLPWRQPGPTEDDLGARTEWPAAEEAPLDDVPLDDRGGRQGEDGARTLPEDETDPGGWPRSEGGGDIFESAQAEPDTFEDPSLPG